MTRLTAPWVTAPAPHAVMEALDGQAFFVGGCVRNALLGVQVTDIDLATPLVPEEIMRRLEAAGLKVVPTGLSHGTVTAVHEGAPVEVTTFRADLETDGRRAEVGFTTNMAVDAARRDFTMNALYADRTGELVDPLGGLADLRARRIRFIGDPHDRIREDYLRILRFFRFFAWYGEGGIDAEGLAAVAELADGLDGLARERVGWEFRKLLSAPDPAPAMASMAAAGVLMHCLPGAEVAALAPLVHVEGLAGVAPDWLARLRVLGAGDLTERLRLSRAEAAALTDLDRALDLQGQPPATIAYRCGAEAARRAALIVAASTGQPMPETLQAEIEQGAKARFPLSARDLLQMGFEPGPALGAELERLETLWVERAFTLDAPTLLSRATRP